MIKIENVIKHYQGLSHQREAISQLQVELEQHAPNLLKDEAAWVKLWRNSSTRPTSFKGGNKEATIAAICCECTRQGLPLNTQKAYVLATVQLETGNTYQPVIESYWLPESSRQSLPYYPYYGRGYVQITHKVNYQRYGDLLNLNLVDNPNLALQPHISLFILVHGFKYGLFTGLKLEDFVNTRKTDFFNARKVINGLDKATTISNYATAWLPKLPPPPTY